MKILLTDLKLNLTIKIAFCISLLLLTFILNAQSTLNKISDGWTIFKPSKNSFIVYVSSSEGDDATGIIYTIKDVGDDPFSPKIHSNLKPFKTFKAAFEKTRNNHPDWILVKRGDSFFENIRVKNGKSLLEPFLIAAYGNNKSNPIFNTADKTALQVCCRSTSNIAIQGLDFYAHTRDPKTSFYISPDGGSGFNIYVAENYTIKNILLEGNRFKFYGGSGIQGPGKFINIVLRRNSFLDSYSTTSHSQGLYAANVTMKLEENIFDHNGWLKQADKDIGTKQGAATIFNHNIYFANSNNVEIVNNVFLRSSSIHNKFTANKGKNSSTNIIIKNNLYVDGEMGISAGGNATDAYRFKDFEINNNVMLNIGRSRPTGRTLGWGMEIQDWDGGIISNNYFLNQENPFVNNVFGLKISGTNRGVQVENNKFYNLMNGHALVLKNESDEKSISITNNKFQFKQNSDFIIKYENDLKSYLFENNQYFHKAGKCQTFESDITLDSLYLKILKFFMECESTSFNKWLNLTDERENQWGKSFNGKLKTIETYQKLMNKEPSIDAFIKEFRNLSMKNWNENYTAKAINEYFKTGRSF